MTIIESIIYLYIVGCIIAGVLSLYNANKNYKEIEELHKENIEVWGRTISIIMVGIAFLLEILTSWVSVIDYFNTKEKEDDNTI